MKIKDLLRYKNIILKNYELVVLSKASIFDCQVLAMEQEVPNLRKYDVIYKVRLLTVAEQKEFDEKTNTSVDDISDLEYIENQNLGRFNLVSTNNDLCNRWFKICDIIVDTPYK